MRSGRANRIDCPASKGRFPWPYFRRNNVQNLRVGPPADSPSAGDGDSRPCISTSVSPPEWFPYTFTKSAVAASPATVGRDGAPRTPASRNARNCSPRSVLTKPRKFHAGATHLPGNLAERGFKRGEGSPIYRPSSRRGSSSLLVEPRSAFLLLVLTDFKGTRRSSSPGGCFFFKP